MWRHDIRKQQQASFTSRHDINRVVLYRSRIVVGWPFVRSRLSRKSRKSSWVCGWLLAVTAFVEWSWERTKQFGCQEIDVFGVGDAKRDQKENRQARIEIDWEDVNREIVEYVSGFLIPSLSCAGVNVAGNRFEFPAFVSGTMLFSCSEDSYIAR